MFPFSGCTYLSGGVRTLPYMDRRFELRCTDRDVEAFKAAAGREAVGAWARRVLRDAVDGRPLLVTPDGVPSGWFVSVVDGVPVLARIPEVKGAGEGGMAERGQDRSMVRTPEGASGSRESVPSGNAGSSPAPSSRSASPSVPAVPHERRNPNLAPKRSGRNTTGAAAGMCVHRVNLDSFCARCP